MFRIIDMSLNLTLRQMEVFEAVARHGNVTRASRELLLSQSAVSMALSELEKQLGEKMFDRRGRKLILNESGRVLLPPVVEVLARAEEISSLFIRPGGGLAGRLRVAASSTVGNYLIPGILGQFAADYPDTRVLLEVGNSSQVIEQVLHFESDLGIIEGFCHHPDIETIPWRKDRLIVFARPDHPLCGRKRIRAQDLGAARWILREQGSGTREVFEAAIAGKLDGLQVFLELGHTEAIKQAVEAGLGISCLSELTLRRAMAAGALVELKAPFLNLERDFCLLLHKEKYRTKIMKAFLSYCRRSSGRKGSVSKDEA
jgi:DNA-binding transcriptional LysR family regulator